MLVILTLLFGLLLSSQIASALPTSVHADDARIAVQSLEARMRHTATLKAAFYEKYNDGNGGMMAESGTVYFSRPGRMRWEYESPEKKLFLVDGTNVWFYVPADHAVSRAKLKESSDWRTPLALLTGRADLKRFCRKIDLVDANSISGGDADSAPLAAKDTVLSCTPRGDSGEKGEGVHKVLFEMDPEARLVRILIREAGHVETEFRFGNWQENIEIPETKFHFVPPPGVAIVDEASLAGKGVE